MKEPEEQLGWCEALYESKAAELLLYGRALGLSESESEDVLQETFIALLRLREAPLAPARYAIRAFRNRALNFKRSLWRRLAREWESRSWFEPREPEMPGEEAALKALRTLPQDQREVIVLKIWHQHTFEEIGELLELSPNTAAGRYRYGMQKLRNHLTKTKYEPDELFGSAVGQVEAAPAIS